MGSKIISLTLIYPASLVRTRFQQNQYIGDRSNPKYKNLRDVLWKTMKHEGFFGFYKGYAVALVGSLPANALFFFLFELFKKKLPF